MSPREAFARAYREVRKEFPGRLADIGDTLAVLACLRMQVWVQRGRRTDGLGRGARNPFWVGFKADRWRRLYLNERRARGAELGRLP